MAKRRKKIEYLPLDDVRPHPDNPRSHDSLADVEASVDELGYIEPIVRDDRTGYLVAGHGRVLVLAAQRDAGQDPPDGVVTNGDGHWLVPVVTGWASADDDAATKARIVLNHTVETGGWISAKLLAQLDGLAAGPTGLEGSGFSDEAVERLRAMVAAMDPMPPDEFGEPNLDTSNECPKCGYRWAE